MLKRLLLLALGCALLACSGSHGGLDASAETDAGGTDSAVADPCRAYSVTECFNHPFECAPAFDDACCPSCTDGPCADCSRPVYLGCHERTDGCGTGCATSPPWGCGPAAPFCEGATVVDDTTCDRTGCVPARASEGYVGPQPAPCRPITADSCTVACRQAEPMCPSGFRAEGDGSCYTGLCVPAWVCASP